MIYKIYCRIYQNTLYIISRFIKWRKPILLKGNNSITKLPKVIKKDNVKTVIILTDKTLYSLGLTKKLENGLKKYNINYVIFDNVLPDPSDCIVEMALKEYFNNNCEGIIAFGGGSSMDCAKALGAKVVRPKKSLKQMKGLLKIRKKLPPLYAIPTTAGTGSEATIAAVITDSKTNTKYHIDDIVLIPHIAVLDPQLTVGLPKNITSITGMDALTHAIEAYIGKSNTKETKNMSKKATKLIFDNILIAYKNGEDIIARGNMLRASYYAGVAFTRAYIGYVHSLAHSLGGMYHIPHGLANSIILPYMLEYYGKSIEKKLSELADIVGITNSSDTVSEKATKFINSIKKLNSEMDIPKHIYEIKAKDVPIIAKQAIKEANPLYPVPVILTEKDMVKILYKIGNLKQTKGV